LEALVYPGDYKASPDFLQKRFFSTPLFSIARNVH
jgi:hypothetical protein